MVRAEGSLCHSASAHVMPVTVHLNCSMSDHYAEDPGGESELGLGLRGLLSSTGVGA